MDALTHHLGITNIRLTKPYKQSYDPSSIKPAQHISVKSILLQTASSFKSVSSTPSPNHQSAQMLCISPISITISKRINAIKSTQRINPYYLNYFPKLDKTRSISVPRVKVNRLKIFEPLLQTKQEYNQISRQKISISKAISDLKDELPKKIKQSQLTICKSSLKHEPNIVNISYIPKSTQGSKEKTIRIDQLNPIHPKIKLSFEVLNEW